MRIMREREGSRKWDDARMEEVVAHKKMKEMGFAIIE